jgi:hypothetical protein
VAKMSNAIPNANTSSLILAGWVFTEPAGELDDLSISTVRSA